ncbi:MAG: hypothetical protein K2X47_16675 [Bdellovibrionales bacterium]|nr:hypothetical protein [Bdellovibrionales bacterium]
MRHFLISVLISFPVLAEDLPRPTSSVFRFQLFQEPTSLDPAQIDGNEGHFLLSILNRGLYKFSQKHGLKTEGAKSCARQPLALTCTLHPKHRYSSGERVLAEDYVRAFRHLINPKSNAFEAGLLLSLKNAKEILAGKLPPESLGVRAVLPHQIQFSFREPDFDFEYKLTSPLLAPWRTLPDLEKANSVWSTGPYKIKEWKPQSKIVFENNPYYEFTTEKTPAKNMRPPVEALFVSDDATALSLYETGRLDLVRRLSTILIPKYEKTPDFFQTPLARFDYIGFGEGASRDFRRALSLSADYDEFRKAFFALGRPGCPSFPEEYMDQPRCLKFDLAEAKKAWGLVSPQLKEKTHTFFVNATGGADLLRSAQWYQSQWKKNLGLKTEIRSLEQTSYVQLLKTKPPAIFRKGYSLDRPSCLAAVETFEKNNPENYLRLDSTEYDGLVKALRSTADPSARKKLCGKIISFLLSEGHFIPQGRIHFSLLIRPSFRGWEISELNLLDLSGLHEVR